MFLSYYQYFALFQKTALTTLKRQHFLFYTNRLQQTKHFELLTKKYTQALNIFFLYFVFTTKTTSYNLFCITYNMYLFPADALTIKFPEFGLIFLTTCLQEFDYYFNNKTGIASFSKMVHLLLL